MGFIYPLDREVVVTGNYGEIRPNHFHAGLDFSTDPILNLPIKSVADGYVSRIKIGSGGYGRVLYITHNNGYVSVYAHQKKYAQKIDEYIKKIQLEQKQNEIEVYPKANDLLVKKGEVIGYTGNSGSSTGPHLHFEIRETKTDDPLNPWLFGFDIKDEIAPTIYGIKVYPLNDTSTINGSNKSIIVKTTSANGKYSLASAINAYGQIGFAVHTIDLTTGSGNQCGPYSIELLYEKDTIFRTVFDKVTFATNRFINAHMDYLAYRDLENSYHKSFIKGNNQLPIYTHKVNNGWLNVSGKDKKNMKFIVKDIYGNQSVLDFSIGVQKTNLKFAAKNCSKEIKWNEDVVFENDEISISFPDSSLYDDLCFDYTKILAGAGYYASIHKLHDDDIPIMHPIELKIKTTLMDTTLKDKLTGVFIKLNIIPFLFRHCR